MKNEILRVLSMRDVLEKYNIPYKRSMFHCPFHKDKNASAKMYDNSFYCFSCNRTGDIIQFVQYLFNLSFKEAMQKINEDFNLGLETNTKIDYKKIRQIENQRKQKELKKKKLQSEFIGLCEKKQKYYKIIKSLESKINYKNWENIVKKTSDFQMQCELINLKLDEIDNMLSSR